MEKFVYVTAVNYIDGGEIEIRATALPEAGKNHLIQLIKLGELRDDIIFATGINRPGEFSWVAKAQTGTFLLDICEGDADFIQLEPADGLLIDRWFFEKTDIGISIASPELISETLESFRGNQASRASSPMQTPAARGGDGALFRFVTIFRGLVLHYEYLLAGARLLPIRPGVSNDSLLSPVENFLQSIFERKLSLPQNLREKMEALFALDVSIWAVDHEDADGTSVSDDA